MMKKPLLYSQVNKRRLKNAITITIDNKLLKEVQSTKFLGDQIDQHLTWTEHLSIISTKMAKGIGIICKAKPYLNQHTLKTL